MNSNASAEQSGDPDRAGWSEKGSKFYDHWTGLRDGHAFPTSQNFLDSPDPKIQPQTFMFERIAPDKSIFRLMATELVTIWGKDFTGLAVEDVFSADVAKQYLADPWSCHANSCGLWERGRFGDMRGRVVTLEIMYLPLELSEDKPPRLIGFLAWTGLSTEVAKRQGLISIDQRRWIEIGDGLPDVQPDIFAV